jgi:diamine N-acetyltransferase
VTITLVPVDAENWWDALELAVHPEQLGFVANYAPIVAFALAKAYVRPNNLIYTPYLVCAGGQPVGFGEMAGQPDDAQPCWLMHLFVDHRHQGKGYGRAAIDAFIQLARSSFPCSPSLRLSVNPDNVVAVQLYARAGFEPTGELYDNGERVYTLRLP